MRVWMPSGVYQRALVSGTELRLVVGSEIVQRVLAMSGVDRVVSIYPFVAASLAAKKTDTGPRRGDNGRPLGAAVTLSLARSEDRATPIRPERSGGARTARAGTGAVLPGHGRPDPRQPR